jgi:hypothetical protein
MPSIPKWEWNGKEIHFDKGTPENIKEALYTALLAGKRVRLTFKKGYEDFSGYHDKTGRVHTANIGISTGTQPILLEIWNERSSGGPGLLTSEIEKVDILTEKKRWV